jgi:hypothetical protein
VPTIEIVGATLHRRSMFEYRENFFYLSPHYFLCSEDRFDRPLIICSYEVKYLVCLEWRSADFLTKVFFPQKKFRTSANILVLVPIMRV